MADPARRSPAKQAAIIAAAARLAAEQGYGAVTIDAIAAAAGVGKQTIYRWWPSKAALYVEVYDGLVAVAADLGAGLPAAARLRAVLVRVFALYRGGPGAGILAGLIADAQHDATARHALIHGLIAGRGPVLTQPLAEARARGELPADFDVDWAAELVVALIWKRVLSDGALDGIFLDRLISTIFRQGVR